MKHGEPVLSDIWEEWYRVQPALDRLVASGNGIGLVPKQVFDECAQDFAQLWTTPSAFMVTKFLTDEHTHEKTLFLWVAAAFTGQKDIGAEYLSFFDGVAKYMNCKYIELWSSRKGMERYVKPQGFEPVYRAYRKAV